MALPTTYGIALSVLLTFISHSAQSMEFRTIASPNGIAIKATGPIVSGDASKFQAIAREATTDKNGLRRMVLESPGGDVAEAMALARIIRSANFKTLVSGDCASACAMVLYPAGNYFVLLDGGRLGFHSCYDSYTHAASPECTEAIAEFAAKNGFPYGSLKAFASLAGPADMHWITNVLAYCYGMERFEGAPPPITVSTLCPKVRLALIDGKFQEADRALGPSFDCAKASLPAELLLCRDPELMHLDALMGKLYRMIRARRGQALVLSQRSWIADRDSKCPVGADLAGSHQVSRDAARCISEMTMARMEELLTLNGTPRLDLSPLIEMSR
jgi:uncharacterized protein YecT (DUF1311 family)